MARGRGCRATSTDVVANQGHKVKFISSQPQFLSPIKRKRGTQPQQCSLLHSCSGKSSFFLGKVNKGLAKWLDTPFRKPLTIDAHSHLVSFSARPRPRCALPIVPRHGGADKRKWIRGDHNLTVWGPPIPEPRRAPLTRPFFLSSGSS